MHHSLARSPIAHRHPTQHAAPAVVRVVVLGVTQVLVVLDGTVVSIALPSISRGLHLATARASYPTDLLPGLLVLGLGTGLVFPAASITAMRDVAGGQAGLASGLVTPTAHEVGAALGVAVFSAVAAAGDHTTAGGGFAAGYRHGIAVAAAIAAALAVGALGTVPPVRPAPGVKAAVS
jgi:hypothetical protein